MGPIAIVNEKGGTAKTTTAVNLSAALAGLGHKVLLVDLDGQAASSRWLNVEDDPRLADAILAGGNLQPIETHVPNLYLAPGSGKLDSVAHELRPTQGGQIRRVLSELDGQFDYVLLDCPPSLGNRLIGNAILAARKALVPVETSVLALDGLRILLTVLDDVRKGFDHDIQLLGVLPCRYDARTRLSRLVVAELERALPDKVFRTRIRETVRIQECPAVGKTIFEYAPNCHAAQDYLALAKEVHEGLCRPRRPLPVGAGLAAYPELTPEEQHSVLEFRERTAAWFQPGAARTHVETPAAADEPIVPTVDQGPAVAGEPAAEEPEPAVQTQEPEAPQPVEVVADQAEAAEAPTAADEPIAPTVDEGPAVAAEPTAEEREPVVQTQEPEAPQPVEAVADQAEAAAATWPAEPATQTEEPEAPQPLPTVSPREEALGTPGVGVWRLEAPAQTEEPVSRAEGEPGETKPKTQADQEGIESGLPAAEPVAVGALDESDNAWGPPPGRRQAFGLVGLILVGLSAVGWALFVALRPKPKAVSGDTVQAAAPVRPNVPPLSAVKLTEATSANPVAKTAVTDVTPSESKGETTAAALEVPTGRSEKAGAGIAPPTVKLSPAKDPIGPLPVEQAKWGSSEKTHDQPAAGAAVAAGEAPTARPEKAEAKIAPPAVKLAPAKDPIAPSPAKQPKVASSEKTRQQPATRWYAAAREAPTGRSKKAGAKIVPPTVKRSPAKDPIAPLPGKRVKPGSSHKTGDRPTTRPAAASRPSFSAPPAGLAVSCIVTDSAGAMALINGRIVRVGQTIEGARVVEIRQLAVVLECDGQYFTLRMGGSPLRVDGSPSSN